MLRLFPHSDYCKLCDGADVCSLVSLLHKSKCNVISVDWLLDTQIISSVINDHILDYSFEL